MSTISASTTSTTAYVVTADTTGTLVLKTGASPTTALTIDTSQNVGIGTTSPSAPLDIAAAAVGVNTRLGPIATMPATQTACYVGSSLSSVTGTGTNGDLLLIPRSSTTANIVFATGNGTPAVRAVIDSSGNFGIGTTSPSGKLHVVGNTYAQGDIYFNTSSGQLSSGSGAWPLIFGINGTEKARIDSSGNLLVGVTSTTGNGGITLRPNAIDPYFYVGGSSTSNSQHGYYLWSSTASAYRFYVSYGGTISAVSTTISGLSDQRLKENIRDLDDGLAKVMALQPRKFDWKEGKGAGTKNARGFIAQEFETVFPDMIEEWLDPAPEGEEPYKAVNANLIPTLVKAIQEQQAIIETLTNRITALEAA